MRFSSEPPTAALFLWGKSRRRDREFRARVKISTEIENFERDWSFFDRWALWEKPCFWWTVFLSPAKKGAALMKTAKVTNLHSTHSKQGLRISENGENVGPDVMQSGFGVNFLILAWWSLGKSPANFSANFDGEFRCLVFPGFHPKFKSRFVGIPLQFHFLEPKIYSRRFSAYSGGQKMAGVTHAKAWFRKSPVCSSLTMWLPTAPGVTPRIAPRIGPLVARTRCVSFTLRCVSKFRSAAYSASRVEFL